ncbi:hypothetical protein H632_c5266p0, partial [Helicosporidium sp. ATCC 50920]
GGVWLRIWLRVRLLLLLLLRVRERERIGAGQRRGDGAPGGGVSSDSSGAAGGGDEEPGQLRPSLSHLLHSGTRGHGQDQDPGQHPAHKRPGRRGRRHHAADRRDLHPVGRALEAHGGAAQGARLRAAAAGPAGHRHAGARVVQQPAVPRVWAVRHRGARRGPDARAGAADGGEPQPAQAAQDALRRGAQQGGPPVRLG